MSPKSEAREKSMGSAATVTSALVSRCFFTKAM